MQTKTDTKFSYEVKPNERVEVTLAFDKKRGLYLASTSYNGTTYKVWSTTHDQALRKIGEILVYKSVATSRVWR